MFGKAEKISLLYEGESVSPAQLFKKAYKPLEELANYNLEVYLTRPKFTLKQDDLIEDTKKSFLSLPTDGTAIVTYEDGSNRMYNIKRRKNMDLRTMKKLPNILFLQDDYNTIVLREARKYDEEHISKLFHVDHGRKYDHEVTAQFYTEEEGKVIKPDEKKYLSYIPENNLTLALERLYKEEEVPRFTPKPTIINEEDPNKVWYMRPMMNLGKAIGFEPSLLGEYLGLIHSLGLIEEHDRQLIHYYHSKKDTYGNYDPDFMLHCHNEHMLTQLDLKDVKMLAEKELGVEDPRFFYEEVRDARAKALQKYKDKGITTQTIFNYLNKKTDLSDCNSLCELF